MKIPCCFANALAIVAIMLMSQTTSVFADDNPATRAKERFLDFSEYGGATILPEQIPAEDWNKSMRSTRTSPTSTMLPSFPVR